MIKLYLTKVFLVLLTLGFILSCSNGYADNENNNEDNKTEKSDKSEESKFIGVKDPETPKAVLDIVFNDGSATPYEKIKKRGITDKEKSNAIAIIFYRDTTLNNEGDNTKKTLGIGLKHLQSVPYENINHSIENPNNLLVPEVMLEANYTNRVFSGFTGDLNGADNKRMFDKAIKNSIIFMEIQPVQIPAGVTVNVANGIITVKGPKGEIKYFFDELIDIKVQGTEVLLTAKDNLYTTKEICFKTRNRTYDMVKGVSEGFIESIVLSGENTRAEVKGRKLIITTDSKRTLDIPDYINVTVVSNVRLSITGVNKKSIQDFVYLIKKGHAPENNCSDIYVIDSNTETNIFEFAENYSDYLKVPNLKDFEKKWYIPTAAELYEITSHCKEINDATVLCGGTNFLNDYEEVLYWTSSKASKTLESSYMKDCYPFVIDIKNKVIFANDLIKQISVPSVCVIRKF